MTEIKNYLNDGACWQAQAVLAFLRSQECAVMDDTWNNQAKAYDLTINVGRFENCRKQGYVFTIYVPHYASKDGDAHQRNWAVYEHRNSDNICVLVSDTFTINTPSIEDMFCGRDKYGYDKAFSYSEIVPCGKFIIDQMKTFVWAHYKKAGE